MEETARCTSSCASTCVLIVLYLALNIALNMLNKILIASAGFVFPLTVCITHMAFSFACLAPCMLLMPRYRDVSHRESVQVHVHGLFVVGTCFALNIGLNNFSLLSVSLSLNQIIRSAIPAVAAAASFCLERRRVSRMEGFALTVLILGVAMTVSNAKSSHAPVSTGSAQIQGLIACVLSTFANGIMMSASGLVLKERMDAMRLTFYQAPIVVACLMPVAWAREGGALMAFLGEEGTSALVWYLLPLTCILALVYNVVHVAVIEKTSAVTTTVIGEAKIVLIVGLSALVLGEQDMLAPLTLVGAFVSVGGFVMYGHARLQASLVDTK